MAQFIRTDRGFLNLDHVCEVHVAYGDDAISYRFHNSQGDLIGDLRSLREIDLAMQAANVVSAAPGSIAYLTGFNVELRRPCLEDFWVETYPILAWRVPADGAPWAVLPEDNVIGDLLVQLPDGRLLSPYDCTYADLEDAKHCLLKRAQLEWDRKSLG